MSLLGLVNPGLTCDAITLKNACAISGEKIVYELAFDVGRLVNVHAPTATGFAERKPAW